jgi:uncharacterized OB-fold protein
VDLPCRVRCPSCLSARLAWQEVSGAARLYTFTKTEAPTAEVLADEVPQDPCRRRLTEGLRLTTTLVETDGKLQIGMAVPRFACSNGAASHQASSEPVSNRS